MTIQFEIKKDVIVKFNYLCAPFANIINAEGKFRFFY